MTKQEIIDLLEEHHPYFQAWGIEDAPVLGVYSKERNQLFCLSCPLLSNDDETLWVWILPVKGDNGYMLSIRTNYDCFFERNFPTFLEAYDFLMQEYLIGWSFPWFYHPDYYVCPVSLRPVD